MAENKGNFTKAELVDALYKKVDDKDLNREQVYKIVGAYTEVIMDAVNEGYKVVIPGLVSLDSKDVPEREHRNPSTGDKIVKPAHRAPKVSVLQKFKDTLAEK